MATNKGFIKDWKGNKILPITRGELVLDKDGNILNEYKKEFVYSKPVDPALLAWLKGKDDELSAECDRSH